MPCRSLIPAVNTRYPGIQGHCYHLEASYKKPSSSTVPSFKMASSIRKRENASWKLKSCFSPLLPGPSLHSGSATIGLPSSSGMSVNYIRVRRLISQNDHRHIVVRRLHPQERRDALTRCVVHVKGMTRHTTGIRENNQGTR